MEVDWMWLGADEADATAAEMDKPGKAREGFCGGGAVAEAGETRDEVGVPAPTAIVPTDTPAITENRDRGRGLLAVVLSSDSEPEPDPDDDDDPLLLLVLARTAARRTFPPPCPSTCSCCWCPCWCCRTWTVLPRPRPSARLGPSSWASAASKSPPAPDTEIETGPERAALISCSRSRLSPELLSLSDDDIWTNPPRARDSFTEQRASPQHKNPLTSS
ncbi:hypothetical protein BC830DRAFT_1137865 [Chytriomyces sp. MP71]|nr:hypothetical protein BC830DRAFT_1137865 [Chytriomyces sp. MP71]